MGLPAVLSEELDNLGKSVISAIVDLMYEKEESEFWLLGASHNNSHVVSKKSIKCGNDFCYKKSLDENKICKPGTLFFLSF